MTRTLALSIGLILTAAIAAAQQRSGASTAPSASTPGVTPGTTGTTFGTPGAMQMPTIPGGGIQQGASTQDATMLPVGPQNYNNSAGNSLNSGPFAPHRNGK